jgi:hypothetical protein
MYSGFPPISDTNVIFPKYTNIKSYMGQVPVAYTCNPSYLGGRDQEDLGLKPARANSLRDPILKKPNMEKG